jgi:hypothetical protein
MGWGLIDVNGTFTAELDPKYGQWIVEHVNLTRGNRGERKKRREYPTYVCSKIADKWGGFKKPKLIEYSQLMCSDAFN